MNKPLANIPVVFIDPSRYLAFWLSLTDFQFFPRPSALPYHIVLEAVWLLPL